MADFNTNYFRKDAYKNPGTGAFALVARQSLPAASQPLVNEFIYLAKLDKNIVIGDFLFAHGDLDTGATGTATVELDDGGVVTSFFTAASFSIQAAGVERMTNQAMVGYKVVNRNARLRVKIVVASTTPLTGDVAFCLIGTSVGADPA